MPIKISDALPAKEILKSENIFVMDESRAFSQDIRPLNIAILNLMPIKQTTEVQLLRMIGNTPLQVDVKLLHMESHVCKNTDHEYLTNFYNVFDDIKNDKLDGMIITGAPIEMLDFKDVSYWGELTSIMEWTKTHVTSTFHICWGAQAGLNYHYGIPKYPLEEKMFGIFSHTVNNSNIPLLRGFDDVFSAPHSRHTEIKKQDIEKISTLEILSESPESGVYIVASKDGKQIFVMGHSEYDPTTLHDEYLRDMTKKAGVKAPSHYYIDNDHQNQRLVTWRSHAFALYSNWLNYYVYQKTPYDLGSDLK